MNRQMKIYRLISELENEFEGIHVNPKQAWLASELQHAEDCLTMFRYFVDAYYRANSINTFPNPDN